MTWNSMREGATLVRRTWIAGLIALMSMPALAGSGAAQTIVIGGPSGQAVQTFSPNTANQYRYYQPALPYRSANRLPVFGQAPRSSGPGLLPLQQRLRLVPPRSNSVASAPVLKAPTPKAPQRRAQAQKKPAAVATVPQQPAKKPPVIMVKPAPAIIAAKPTAKAPEAKKKQVLKVTPPAIKKPVTVAKKPAVKADPSELKMPAAPRDNKQPIIAAKIAPPPKPAAKPEAKPAPKPVIKVETPPEPAKKPAVKAAPAPKVEAPVVKPPKAIIVTKDADATKVAALPPKDVKSEATTDAGAAKGGPVSLSFNKGDQKLTRPEQDKLDRFHASISGKKVKIQLIAYADAGSGSASRRLSLSRALTVRSHLMNLGMANTSIEVRALGLPKDNKNPDRVDLKMLDR